MGAKVFLVGDDKQSIYRFRGSDVNNSIKMGEYISKINPENLSLTENFRSDPKIIKTINSIFSSSFMYDIKKLKFENTALLISKINEQSEEMPAILCDDSNIVEIVQNMMLNRTIRGKPIGYGDIAILCRKNYMVDNISESFKRMKIPVEVIGGHGFYRAKEVTDIYKYLNYIVYQKEEYKKELKFSDIYKSLLNYKCDDFDKFLEDLCDVAQGNSVGMVLDFLIENSNIYEYYSQIGYYQSISNIEKLKSISYNDTESDYMSVISFLEFIKDKITMGTEEDEAPVSQENREKGVISICTIHKAKGLSFPIVIISNMDENLINYKRLPKAIMKCKDKKVGLGFSRAVIGIEDMQYKKLAMQYIVEALEEEIRIFYVACTRAKHMLIFSCDKPLKYVLKSDKVSWAKWLIESKVLDTGDVYMNKEYVNNIKNKFLRNPSSKLMKEELLSLILSYVDPYRDTNDISKALLKQFGSIRNLLDADVEDISTAENIGLNSAILLKTYTEIMRTYMRELKNNKDESLTYEDICNIVKANLLGKTSENVFVILMNGKRKLLYSEILREGNINNVDIYIEDIVKLCIRHKAVYLIIAHNHPSGSLIPSSNDIDTTRRLNEALRLINVKLIDHIIFAEGKCSSFAREGLGEICF